jgi:acylphosphatase
MAASHAIQRRLYHYSGRVQGVGFRYTVKNIALRYNVAGYVRNLPDGRVECCLEGPEGELDDMAEEIARKMGGFIRNVTFAEEPAGGGLVGFVIRH